MIPSKNLGFLSEKHLLGALEWIIWFLSPSRRLWGIIAGQKLSEAQKKEAKKDAGVIVVIRKTSHIKSYWEQIL